MQHLFAQLHESIKASGFTALSNPLEDFFLARLPDSYYRVWRHLWRKTVGWNKLADFISMRDFADNANVHTQQASRAINFFALAGLAGFEPGQKGQNKSRITVLPNGLPDEAGLDRLFDYVEAVRLVEHAETRQRRKDKHFTFRNDEFCARVESLAKLIAAGNTSVTDFDAALACVREPVR